MLRLSDIEQVLDEYVEQFVPAMLRWQYHLTLVKGGPEYPHLPEQSHFAHIVNGVFALAELLKFLITERVLVAGLDETTVRKSLALYTVHEVHKMDDYAKLGKSEFAIPLERLREEYDRLGLSEFAAVDEHLMRMANVHKRSSRQGDVLLSDAGGSLLWLLVRLADNLASAKTPAEARSSLAGYLKNLGPAFMPKSPPGKYALYYHEIKDVRGVLTNTIHQAVAQQLWETHQFYPLLYFATGTLYLGPSEASEFDRQTLVKGIVDRVLNSLIQYGSDSADAIRSGLRRTYFDFETFVYSFASVPALLDIVRDDCLISPKPDTKVIGRDIAGLLAKKGLPDGWTDETVMARLGISQDGPRAFNEHWVRARRYLFYVDKMLRVLNPAESAMEWFLENFEVPDTHAAALLEVGELWAKGGPGKYVLPVAYHFLRGPDFSERPAEALPPERVLDKLHRWVLAAMKRVDTHAGRQEAVADLGFRQDLTTYLGENLYLSFAPAAQLADDALAAYTAVKRKGHSNKMCSLCNRQSDCVQDLRTGILDDFGRVFSNRVLPAREAPGANRPWCPICHLEFIFRKLTGLGLPPGATYGKSYRIYLYVLPTFSFTSEHLRLFRPLLQQFDRVTGLPVRDYGREWGLPHRWLVRRTLDPEWVADVMDVLERQAEKIAGWGGRAFSGERVMTGSTIGQPHYYLITWEKPARDAERDDARIATRTEAWAKALFAAVVISGLTACKVYVTERPYLPVADPADLKPTITLDSPPPALRGMLGGRSDAVSLYGRERGEYSGLEKVLDLGAALWAVTADVHAPNRPTKDKHIAGRLGLVNVNPLAGAHFYREYSRLNDDRSPFPTLARACEVLLKTQGGELMGLVEQIAEKALAIGLPRGTYGRGKARRYELVFREGVDAMRKAFDLVPELRETALTGRPPSADSIAELKRLASGTLLKGMERRQTSRRGEIFVNPWRKDLGQLTGELLDLLVDEVYLKRARGSFARFLRLENSLADGIYYYTDRNLSRLWDEYTRRKAAREAEEAVG
jgi:hypothetical protein